MKNNKWTIFWDMHSGGGTKEEPYDEIYIETPEDEAKIIFYNRFGHNPERVSCTCCGDDYSIDESESLEQASGYHRRCKYVYKKDGKIIPDSEGWVRGKGVVDGVWSGYIEEADNEKSWQTYQPLEEYVKNPNVLVIYAKDIKPEEREGDVPQQGYVWQD